MHRGRTARDLSLSIELSAAAVAFMESHPASDVKLSSLTRLARELDVNPAWLAWGLMTMEGFPEELKTDRNLIARRRDET